MFRLFDIFNFTLERLRQHLVLVLLVVVGIIAAITLALSLPLYVDAVYSDILSSRLDNPPYAYRLRYLGAWNGNIAQADVQQADATINNALVQAVGLPTHQKVRYTRAGMWRLNLSAQNMNLGAYGLGSLQGAESYFRVTQGEWKNTASDSNRLPLLVPEQLMFTAGVQVGDEVTVQGVGGQPVEAVIAAMWLPAQPDDPTWIFPPRFFEQVILVPYANLLTLIDGMETPIDEAAWYFNFDGTSLRTSDIPELLETSQEGMQTVEKSLQGIRVDLSPNEGLQNFLTEVNALIQQLFIIALPVVGLVLYFVSLVAGLLVRQQQADDVVLRSRGMSRWAILRVHILLWLLIIGVAFSASAFASQGIVHLIGHTASFLDFTGQTSVNDVTLTTQALIIGAVAGIVAASSGLLLAGRITQQTITNLKQRTQQSNRAWWQRLYLDVILAGVAIYTLYTLWQQNGITSSADSPFDDPLTFVAPTLFSLGLSLLFVRLLPMLTGIIARVLSVTSNIALMMAFREVTRRSSQYRGTLLMMAFTLSLTGFTASMASTLDASLHDVTNYTVGAEMVVVTLADAQTEQDNSDSESASQTIVGYNVPPVQDVRALPQTDYVSRFGRYPAQMQIGVNRLNGLVIGIDRTELAGVALVRDDFFDESLGAMLNGLAGNRTGILLSQQTADAHDITVGDMLTYQVQALGEWQSTISVQVVGLVDYFPTLDPNEHDFFLLTSIDAIFEYAGTPLPHNIWLHVADGYTIAETQAAIDAINFPVVRYLDPYSQLALAQAEPSRRGVLGFLSVGFVAAIALTIVTTVIQSVASLRRQSSQLGALRAMGLSSFSVTTYVFVVQILIVGSGVLSGTAIGFATTRLFLPMFDFSGGLPPYIVRVSWNELFWIYGIIAVVLFGISLLLAMMLTRQQLNQAVKLGNL